LPLHNPYWVLVANLAGRIDSDRMDYVSPAVARERLVELAGEDFGMDAAGWTRWLVSRGYLEKGEFSPDRAN
jgi:hypothetical protein